MSEILIKRLKESTSKEAIIFLKNGFRFQGKLLNSDEVYVELLDFKSDQIKVFPISEISELDIKEGSK